MDNLKKIGIPPSFENVFFGQAMGHWPLLLGKKREVPCIIDIKNGNELNIFRNRYWKMVYLYELTEVRKLAEAEVQF